jgi:hypothetical protein
LVAASKNELVGLTADNKRLRALVVTANNRHQFNTAKARANAVRVVELENENAALKGQIAGLEAALKAAKGVHA